jgi:hypothetical protein
MKCFRSRVILASLISAYLRMFEVARRLLLTLEEVIKLDLKRILVAINSSNRRDAAFERALAIARSSGAELYLLLAVPASQRFSFRAVERLERMAEIRQRADDSGVRVHTVEQHGNPA